MSTSAEQERWECPNCGTPLNIASLGIYAKVACPACGHVDHVHTTLANFRIEGVLGLGGMSVVLRARDLVLERPLAIKLLNEFYRDQPERIARFEQECELMAKVRHENVVSVYSAGREKGQFYIAMELVNGRNLEELVQESGPMEPAIALDVVRQVVLGLDAAHKAGLLHRDMKPGNIIICDNGQAKVLDFGLSLGKRDEDTEEIIWATPYYVPPETLMREPEDTRTDIYALGMTLRHLLTGQENFEPAPEGIEDMLECKRHLPRMVEQMPGLPEPYCDLIDHMTGYDPVSRPAGYTALLTEIDEVRALLASRSRKEALSVRMRRMQPIVAGAVGTLALGCAAAALTAILFSPEPERQYITPETSLQWRECDQLAQAREHLRNANLEQAAIVMQELANSEGEATACAWASLHAAMLFNFCLSPDEQTRLHDAQHYTGRFMRAAQRSVAPAGRDFLQQMQEVYRMPEHLQPENKVLQAILCLLRAGEALHRSDAGVVERHLQQARAALRAAGDEYVFLADRLPQAEVLVQRRKDFLNRNKNRAGNQTASSASRAGDSEKNARYSRLVSELKLDEASRLLEEIEKGATDAGVFPRLAVQKEALAIFREAVEMMERCALRPSSEEELTSVRLQEVLAPLDEPTLSAEIATLMLMAQGEFEDAAALNPHGNTPQSREPFAVLMRDWLNRVR